MAEEAPTVGDLTTDEVHGVADALVHDDTLSALRATWANVSGRLAEGSNGTVCMRTENQDPNVALWSAVRVVSNNPVLETHSRYGWGLTAAQLTSAELFCGFGTGLRVTCLVNFVLPRRCGSDGTKRRPRGAPAVSPGPTNARAGGHVAFKDANGGALRGVIMTMSLYLPASRGASLATNCGDQVVVFAIVFVAVRLTWQLVVRLAGPTSFHSLVHSLVLPPMEQTLYESKDVAVEGCPRAVVCDPTYLTGVHAAYSKELAIEANKVGDSVYWRLTRVPNQVDFELLGVTNEQVASAEAELGRAWNGYFEVLTTNGNPQVPQDENDLSVSVKTVNSLLAFNATRPNHVPNDAERYVTELACLDYTNLPVVVKPKDNKKDPKNDEAAQNSPPARSPSPAAATGASSDVRSEIPAFEFASKWTKKADTGRMQLTRLVEVIEPLKDKPTQAAAAFVTNNYWTTWWSVAKHMKNEKNPLPAWFLTQPLHQQHFCTFLDTLKNKYLPESWRFEVTDVVKLKTFTINVATERMKPQATSKQPKTKEDKSSGKRPIGGGGRKQPAKQPKSDTRPTVVQEESDDDDGVPEQPPEREPPAQQPPKRATQAKKGLKERLIERQRGLTPRAGTGTGSESHSPVPEVQDPAQNGETMENTFGPQLIQSVVQQVDHSLVTALTNHEELIANKVAVKVQDVVRTVGKELQDSAVPADAAAAENKLQIAKSIIRMLMTPYRLDAEAAGGSAAAGPGSVRKAMDPYVACAKLQASVGPHCFTEDEINELLGQPALKS